MEEYLTVAEVAGRFKVTPKTVRNRMYDGTWRRGVHWFAPRGTSPRFRWSALVTWLETPDEPASDGAAYSTDIRPPLRGRRGGRREPLTL